ncbi:unnamed protein product [Discula destructiva]
MANDHPPPAEPPHPDGWNVAELSKKYNEEKEKRLRADGQSQYEELSKSSRLASLGKDPFADHEALNKQPSSLKDGQEVQVLILGAGFGGLLYAARMIEAGLKPDDIRLVDFAGGFGGTWYWNRYPGLMCDTEAFVYCPLLEETGYMPKHQFSYGEELRQHAERIASHYGLADKGVFRTTIKHAEWNEETRRWQLQLEQDRGPQHEPIKMAVTSQFFGLCAGVLNHPKAPKIPGLEDFQGSLIHTARWDYHISGGSPENQELTAFKGKRIGIIGTGASAVQAVPKLAEVASDLFVFQRTPTAVNPRGQKAMDPEEWRTKIATKPGWQIARRRNFELLTQGEPADDESIAITDHWTKLPTNTVYNGNSAAPAMEMSDIPAHIGGLLARDVPFQEAVRQRVDDVVRDRTKAEILKPWYPTWCKRPGFHDDYLDAFNRPNVHLLDTSGNQGRLRASSTGLALSGQSGAAIIPLDVLILATGYRSPATHSNPGGGADLTIVGRGGTTMADKWAGKGAGSLHGVVTAGFPNFFMSTHTQVSVGPCFTSTLDVQAQHVAYIVSEALRRAEDPKRLAVEVSEEAEEAWAAECVKYGLWASPFVVCTPGYNNAEGDVFRNAAASSAEDQMRQRRTVPYMKGLPAFRDLMNAWEADGKMDGIVLRS